QAGDDPDALRAALTQAFGGKASSDQIEQLAQQILAGDTPIPANIKFVKAESLVASNYGAYYPQDGGTIYLYARCCFLHYLSKLFLCPKRTAVWPIYRFDTDIRVIR
ncbi:hypothetical protein N9383_06875, partial [Granulosicoccus sp.]|nr:hypothetical protein [Granulosicoccus sp.]